MCRTLWHMPFVVLYANLTAILPYAICHMLYPDACSAAVQPVGDKFNVADDKTQLQYIENNKPCIYNESH